MYCVPGVAGGVPLGSSPRRARWVGVRGMSERSSFGRNRGYRAVKIFIRKTKRRRRITMSGYIANCETSVNR